MRRGAFPLALLSLLLWSAPLAGEDWGFDPAKLGLRVPDTEAPAFTLRVEEPAMEYDLDTMRRMNPDFTTYPDVNGIVWLKQTVFSRAGGGGVERTDLRVILGRRGLDEGWLTWHIQDPAGGSAEMLEAAVYSPDTGRKVRDVPPSHDAAGLHTVSFSGLPETFILAVAWRQTLPEQIAFEGLCRFSSDAGRRALPVWESIVEVRAPAAQELIYHAFPENARPETEEGLERTLTWRHINVPQPSEGLSVSPEQGVAFGTRRGEAALTRLMREAEAVRVPPAPSAALEGFRRSKEDGMARLLSWLQSQPEVVLAEGAPREIPASGPWTREEKFHLALGWLVAQGVGAAPFWRMPLDPREDPPVCADLLQGPVLELPVLSGNRQTSGTFYCDMTIAPVMGVTSPLLRGAKLMGLSPEKRLIQKRIPATKPGDNRLSVTMDLKMDGQGVLSGQMRVLLRGAWGPFLLPGGVSEAAARGMVPALFPGLQNYSGARLRRVKGVPELSFTLDGRPGVAGSGQGILALLPPFEPTAFRELAGMPAPIELRFPFVLDQTVNIDLPGGVDRALISGSVARAKEKINYSESYTNRRRRLLAEARFEAGVTSVTGDNVALLRRNMERWRGFSSRPIPVQVRAR